MLTVIAYDIVDDRRRDKVSTLLEDYGTRVNYSVFECELEHAELTRLQDQLAELINDHEDRIVCYRLCEHCRARKSAIGVIEGEPRKKSIVIV